MSSLIYVIRALPSSYYGIQIPNTADETIKSQVLCFKKKKDAMECKKFLCYYKHHYGKWPINYDYHKQPILPILSRPNLEGLYNNVIIEEQIKDDFETLCSKYNMSFALCNSFDFSTSPDSKKIKINADVSETKYTYSESIDLYKNVKLFENLYLDSK